LELGPQLRPRAFGDRGHSIGPIERAEVSMGISTLVGTTGLMQKRNAHHRQKLVNPKVSAANRFC